MSALQRGGGFAPSFPELSFEQQIETIVARSSKGKDLVPVARNVLVQNLGLDELSAQELAFIIASPPTVPQNLQIQLARQQISQWAQSHPRFRDAAQVIMNNVKKGIDAGVVKDVTLFVSAEQFEAASQATEKARAGIEASAAAKQVKAEARQFKAEQAARKAAMEAAFLAEGGGLGAAPSSVSALAVRAPAAAGAGAPARREAVAEEEPARPNPLMALSEAARASAMMNAYSPAPARSISQMARGVPPVMSRLQKFIQEVSRRNTTSDVYVTSGTAAMQQLARDAFAEMVLFWELNLGSEFAMLQDAVKAADTSFKGRLENVGPISDLEVRAARQTANSVFVKCVDLYYDEVTANRSFVEEWANGIVFLLVTAISMMIANGVPLSLAVYVSFMVGVFLFGSVFGFSDAEKKKRIIRRFLQNPQLPRLQAQAQAEPRVSAAEAFGADEEFAPVESVRRGSVGALDAVGSVGSSALGAASNAAGSAVGAVGSVGSSALGAVSNAAGSAVGAVASVGSSALGAVGGVAGSALGLVGSAVGALGPQSSSAALRASDGMGASAAMTFAARQAQIRARIEAEAALLGRN